MNKIQLILASALLFTTATTLAQDTTKLKDEAAEQREGPGVGTQKSDDHRKDMTAIQSSEVPEKLRTTLKGKQYKGWEKNSTIYRSRNNDSFLVEMREGDQVKVHRFDQHGKAVKDYD
jgi:uncharacterized protein YdeI (BOF family)